MGFTRLEGLSYCLRSEPFKRWMVVKAHLWSDKVKVQKTWACYDFKFSFSSEWMALSALNRMETYHDYWQYSVWSWRGIYFFRAISDQCAFFLYILWIHSDEYWLFSTYFGDDFSSSYQGEQSRQAHPY